MLAIFDDTSTLRHALGFEAALANAEAAEALVSPEAAAAIALLCATIALDPAELAAEAAHAGTLAIPLVARLRAGLPQAAAAVVHKGATSQDLADTVLCCQIRDGAVLLGRDVAGITACLSGLAARHATTPALGRTLLQDARPIGFGLRLAQWRAGICAAAERLEAEVARHAVLQFGGAGGTREGLEGKGAAVAARLGGALGLRHVVPWHARRGGLAGIAAAVAILIGALGKMARDISLLSQNAIGEAYEPSIPGRGGSSAMAHKRNPTGCQIALAACHRAPGLVAGILFGMPAEEERGLGGWQAEGPAIAELFLLAAGSAAAMAEVAQGLEIDVAAITRNLAAAGLGEEIGDSAALVAQLLADMREG
ncbi:3-carboxy-cis,cis-muconate cycloisomerase [Ancylobacter sp. 3268]|uniref:lyase family protein n=1 Tax=Ancylobacter sp. 3268 TaxID=2817752 RepID=UPI00285764E5|nr:lyase family protein [Ancylobacter sp. 3268]MDR6954855.1 3-carboxy-cis,cis-muconate cycloisomerase [Ancylobacter sp. 3268]